MIDIPANTEKWFRTGSTYICNPPVQDTDYDLVLYVRPENFDDFLTLRLADGWVLGGSRNEQEDWLSLKKRHDDGITYNLLVTHSEDHYNNMYIATSVAKHLNLLHKEDRVMLFHAIVDAKVPIDVEGSESQARDLFW